MIFERIVILFIISLFFTFSYAVLKTAEESKENIVIKQHRVKELSLPEKCRPLLYDGEDQWAECMGVGKK
jgi:hypothetical protein